MGGEGKQVVRIVLKHMNFWELKRMCMVRPACELAAWSRHANLSFSISKGTKNSIKLFVVAVN